MRSQTLLTLVFVYFQYFPKHASTEPLTLLNVLPLFIAYEVGDRRLNTAHESVIRSSSDYMISMSHLWNNTGMTFLISLDFREPNEIISAIVQKLTQVALHNRQSETLTKIWLSVHPRETVSADIKTAINITTNVNQISNETITTLLLDYGLLQLTSASIPLVREDIQITSKMTRSENLRCGLIIDSMNCLTSTDRLTKLGLTSDHILIINDDYMSYAITKLTANVVAPCILKLQNTGISIGFATPTVNWEHPVEDEKTKHVVISKNKNFTQPNVESDNKTSDVKRTTSYLVTNVYNVTQNTPVRMYNPLKNQQEWLNKPMEFDKTYFGTSIYAGNTYIAQHKSVFTPMLSQFRTIFIETDLNIRIKSVREFVRKITHAAAQVNFNKQITSVGNRHFDDGGQTEFYLVTNVWFADFNLNKGILNALREIIAAGNEVYPGAVTTMLFNWSQYVAIFNGTTSTINPQPTMTLGFVEQAEALLDILEYANALNQTDIRYGVTWDIGTIDDDILEDDSIESQAMFFQAMISQAAQVKIIFLKLNIELKNFSWQTLLYFTRTFIFSVSAYIYLLKGPLAQLSRNNPTIGVYVGINGCLGGPYSNITKTSEFVLFWEKIQDWAVTEGILVVMNTAYETNEIKNMTACRRDYMLTWRSDCMCGWWHVSNESDGASEDTSHWRLQVEDRKSIARRLNADNHPHSPNPNKTNKETNTHIPTSYNLLSIFLSLGGFMFCVLLAAVTIYLVHYYRSKDLLSQREVRRLLLGGRQRSVLGCENEGTVNVYSKRYDNERHEIKPSSFLIDLNRPLGEGEFASVYVGAVKKAEKWAEVAVKMKSSRLSVGNQKHGNTLALKGLIAEIKILSYVGEHPNIIRLEGAYTAKLRKGKILVFLELCPNGSLDNYLRSYPADLNNVVNETGSTGETSFTVVRSNTEIIIESEKDDGSPMPAQLANDLVRWSREVACGMKFLTSMKLIHGDLATRNVLLDDTKTAKISDFGLSRRLYDYTEYVKQEQASLPWRWLAPESLRKNVYTDKTDVWSFGVTLWEMYTLGDLPYPGLSYDVNFPALLTGGVRLSKPKYSSNRLYTVMKKCWELCPEDRPSFVELQTMLMPTVENTSPEFID